MADTENSKKREIADQSAKLTEKDASSGLIKTSEDAAAASTERSLSGETLEKPPRRANDAMLTELANRKREIFLEQYPLKQMAALNPHIKESVLLEALGEYFKDEADTELYRQTAYSLSDVLLGGRVTGPADPGLSLGDFSRPGLGGIDLGDLTKPGTNLGDLLDILGSGRVKGDLAEKGRPIYHVNVSALFSNIDLYKKMNVTATSYPSEKSQEVSWFSDNPAVATVRDDNIYTVNRPELGDIYIIKPPGTYAGKGIIETHSVGSARISAQNQETGVVGSCTITVQIFPKSITVSPAQREIANYQLFQLTATVLPANATDKSVTWRSTNPTIISVTDTGLVQQMVPNCSTAIPIIATTNVGGLSAVSNITCWVIN